jgi:hypothetical protein
MAIIARRARDRGNVGWGQTMSNGRLIANSWWRSGLFWLALTFLMLDGCLPDVPPVPKPGHLGTWLLLQDFEAEKLGGSPSVLPSPTPPKDEVIFNKSTGLTTTVEPRPGGGQWARIGWGQSAPQKGSAQGMNAVSDSLGSDPAIYGHVTLNLESSPRFNNSEWIVFAISTLPLPGLSDTNWIGGISLFVFNYRFSR